MTADSDEHEGRRAAPGRQAGGTEVEDTLAPPPASEAVTEGSSGGEDPGRAHPGRPTTPSP